MKRSKRRSKRHAPEIDPADSRGRPRLFAVLAPMTDPNASRLGDGDYLEAVLAHAAAAMFPLADPPPRIDVHARDAEGDPVLLYVCRWGDLRAVRLLVEAGADVNSTGEMEQTPLHCAVSGRFPDLVDLLLRRGARKDRKDAFGYTPLGWARQMGFAEVVALLER